MSTNNEPDLPDGGRTTPDETPPLPPPDTDETPTQVVDHGQRWTVGSAASTAVPEAEVPRTEVIETGVPESGRPRRRLGVAALVGGLGLALIAAGGVYAYNLLSGGGSQPEQYVPANAIAFIKADLDPSAGQKIAAVRYFRHFPEAADVLGDQDDIKKIIFELAQDANETLRTLDYDEDIEPWLGDRVGVAVIPPERGDEPDVVTILQVRDKDKAADGLDQLFAAADGQAPGVVFTDGYALLAEDEAIAERARQAAADASLADDETFRDDMADFEDGVGAFWVDLDGIGDLASELGRTVAASSDLDTYFDQIYRGRIAGVVSFDDEYADLTIRGVGTSGLGLPAGPGEPVEPLMATLPSDTLFALAYTGLDESLEASWNDLLDAVRSEPAGADIEAAIAQVEAEFGIVLPDELLTLLGSKTLFSIAGDTLVAGAPTIAYRAETDTAAAEEVLEVIENLVAEQGGELPLVWRTEGSTLLVGASPADISAVQSGTGIADTAARTALPNLENAQQAVWIDFDRLSEIFLEETGSVPDETLSHIAGVGLTATAGEDGDWTATLRVVAD